MTTPFRPGSTGQAAKPARRGIATIADIKARCTIDPVTHCWHWQGAKAMDGTPRIWTFDHELGDKRAMSGPKAVWNIAFGEAPRGLAYRGCHCADCVNPAHLRLARDKAEIGAHITRAGTRKGTALESRRKNIRVAQLAAGIILVPESTVLEILREPKETTNTALGLRLGCSHSTVSNIRRGKTRADVARAHGFVVGARA